MYDCIVVGSGPIGILEAIYRNKKGQKVLLLEKRPQLAGAWGTVQHNGLPPLEIGCHIWDHNKEVYAFFQQYLGVKLEPLKPAPKIVYSNWHVPYQWKTLVFFLRKTFLGKKAKRETVSWQQMKILPTTYQYPKGGATEFAEKLVEKLKATSVEVRQNANATSLAIEEEKVVVTASGNGYETKEVVATSLAELQQVAANGKEHSFSHKVIHYVHAHVVIKGNKGKRFSYLRLMKDNIIHRISDATGQLGYANQQQEGKQVFIVGIYQHAWESHSQEELQQLITGKLKGLKLLHKNAAVEAVYFNDYPSHYFQSEDIQQLKQAGKGKVHVLHSTNLVFGIARQLKRWQEELR